MNIEELQKWVSDDWKQHSTSSPSVELQLLFIMEELGEVAEAIRKNSGDKDRIQKVTDLGSEIADLIVSITTLANHFNINLTNEIKGFQDRIEERRTTARSD
ncbi:MAG: MazG nucleotide pyrophosphohydrolase domain-containing protein [Candidatus Saccharimonadales bacterium]